MTRPAMHLGAREARVGSVPETACARSDASPPRGPAFAAECVRTQSSRPAGPDRGAALALMACPRLGPARLWRALGHFGGAGAAYEAIRAGRAAEISTAADRLGDDDLAAIEHYLRTAVVGPMERLLDALGGRVLVAGSDGFPARLEDAPGAPPMVAIAGALTDLDRPAVAIVGTRRATITGLSVARRLGRELAEAGYIVVSGMALGVDGAAHHGAIEASPAAGGSAVGILGCGVDVVYPSSHRELYRRVLERGALVSQFGLGVSPDPWRFPVRNRTISGLADGVVVVEAFATGGALSTAKAASEQGREVMVVPGSVENPAAAGVLALLRDGAAPVSGAADVAELLGAPSMSTSAGCPATVRPPPGFVAGDRGGEEGLRVLERKLLQLMADGAERTPFELADASGALLTEVLEAISALIDRGLMVRLSDGLFRVPPVGGAHPAIR